MKVTGDMDIARLPIQALIRGIIRSSIPKHSPLFNADKIKTPLLLLHGNADTNVPVGESIQMFLALKLLGKTVEFVQVDGEDHGVADYKKRLEWQNTIFGGSPNTERRTAMVGALYPERHL